MNTKFFTGSGDNGNVNFAGKELKKSDICFECLGLCDELNVLTGYASSKQIKDIQKNLYRVQEMLFVAQAEIAGLIFGGEKKIFIEISHVAELEEMIKEYDKKIPTLKTFIVPRGSDAVMLLEIARVKSREFERVLIKLSEEKVVSNDLKKFANRLSSFYFASARFVNYEEGREEVAPEYK